MKKPPPYTLTGVVIQKNSLSRLVSPINNSKQTHILLSQLFLHNKCHDDARSFTICMQLRRKHLQV